MRATEKALLNLLRHRGALSKADLARLSSMSAQGVSIIVERLLDLDLVRKGEKMRGRVGQPSTPIILNPEGAMSLGIRICSQEAQLVVADFRGVIRGQDTVTYPQARDRLTTQRIVDAAMKLPEALGSTLWKRRVGIGIAASENLLGFFSGAGFGGQSGMANPSLGEHLEGRFDVPVHCVNDIRAACIAELVIGSAHVNKTLLYFNLGLSLGTGIVLEGRVIGPENQLSSGLHALPMAGMDGVRVGDLASLASLRRSVEHGGFDFLAQLATDFSETQDLFMPWRAGAIQALEAAIQAASATLGFDRVLIASQLGRGALSGLVRELRHAMETNVDSRIRFPEISMNTVAPYPCARGAAMVPFLKVFGMPDAGMNIRRTHRDVA